MRRAKWWAGRLIGWAALVSITADWAALVSIAADWPQFLGPRRDGSADDAAIRTRWPQQGPPRLWRYPLGAGWSGPVVVQGRAYIFHRLKDREVLDCLEVKTGKRIWRDELPTDYVDDFNFDDGPRATPAIAGQSIVTLGASGVLAVRATPTGQLIWQRNINRDYNVRKGFFGTATSPLVVGQKVIVNVGGQAKGAGVVAFDLASGKELWRTAQDEVSYSSPALATIHGEPVAVFLTRAGLLGVGVERGTVKFARPWRARLHASVNGATPLVRGSQVFVSASYSTGALLVEVAPDFSLKELWKGDDILSCHYNTPVRIGDFLYGVDGRAEAGPDLVCVEWASGKVRWRQERFGCAGLITVGRQIVAINDQGEAVVFAADPTAYRELARARVLDGRGPVRAMPALADGLLLARDTGQLVCVDLRPE
jgi:outer membrane protein assembly factor BamB